MAALAALALTGCGYVGDPLPPKLEMPKAIADLRGVQRGAQLILAYTPTLTASDKTLLKSLSAVEVGIGAAPAGGFQIARWADGARRFRSGNLKADPQELSVDARQWQGQDVVVAVRAAGPKGRFSEWSNVLALHVVAPPETPKDLKVLEDVKGPYVTWSGPGALWRVWRLAEGEETPAVLGNTAEKAWLDQTAELGKRYVYTVQQLVAAGAQEAESEMSVSLKVDHQDVFPPAVPKGLNALAGLKTIELNWDRNVEPDLAGYFVYRAEGAGELKKVSTLLERASYSDTAVAAGKSYRYAVTAVDEKGNESEKTAPVELAAP